MAYTGKASKLQPENRWSKSIPYPLIPCVESSLASMNGNDPMITIYRWTYVLMRLNRSNRPRKWCPSSSVMLLQPYHRYRTTLVTDRFHAMQQIGRAHNKTRIQVMNADKLHHTKLKSNRKRFWKRRRESVYNNRWSPRYQKLMIEPLSMTKDRCPELFDTYAVD